MNDIKRIRGAAAAFVLAAGVCLTLPVAAQYAGLQRLPELNVDPAQVSVGGHSAGGAMAIQLGVAYSSRIMGVAASGAPPYDSRRNAVREELSCVAGIEPPDISEPLANARRWFGREIDPQEYLRQQRVFLFSGAYDTCIARDVMKQTWAFYDALIPAENILFETDVPTGHGFPVDYLDPNLGPPTGCRLGGIWPDCAYDGAGRSLSWIYGPLAPRTESVYPGGDLRAVDQGEFVDRAQGMDDIAFLYVPKACASGDTVCKLHIFLHACSQSFFDLDSWAYPSYLFYPEWSGHSRWAETNRIVLLFPQTYPDDIQNKQGCWDFEGRYDDRFDQKGGTQIEAIMAMVKRITGGFAGNGAVEFYHQGYDHYVVSAQADEKTKLDDGTFAGWQRTGESFAVHPLDTPGASNVCRFYTEAFPPSSSHFYTPVASECEVRKADPKWQYEGVRFALMLPDAAGNCATGTRPLYRLYNDGQGGAPNHRYVVSAELRTAMIARGWIAEGSGIGVIGCVPI